MLSTDPNVGSDDSNKLNSLAWDSRVRLWTGRRQRSAELKQRYEGNWTNYWQWYRNEVIPLTDAADWWRSNEQIPTVFKIIETLLPRYVTGMFSDPDWFTVEARTPNAELYERKCYELLKTTLEEMKVFPEMVEALRYSLIMGHAWGKVVWETETIKRQKINPTMATGLNGQPVQGVEQKWNDEVVYDGPKFEWRTLDVVFPDPSGRGRWYTEDIDTTLADIEQTQVNEGIYDEAQLAALRSRMGSAPRPDSVDALGTASIGSSSTLTMEYQREPDATEGISQYLVSPMREGQGVKLWQCWGYVDPQYRGEDGAEWRLLVIADGQYILRDEPSPTPDMKPPYFAIKSIPIPKVLYGESIINYIGPLADQQSRLANMRLDEVFINIHQTFLAKAGRLPASNQLLIMPGAVAPVQTEQGESLADVIAPIPRRPVFSESWTEEMARQTQAEHVSAASDITQGVEGNDRTTATEAQLRVQQGNARHLLQVMWNDYTVKNELLRRTWDWQQMRMSKAKVLRVTGEAIDISQIQEPIDINVGSNLFALSKQARLQMDQELVGLLQTPQFAAVAKPDEIFRQLLQDRGWKKIDRFVKTPQEIQGDMARQQIQQILQGGPGPSGPTGPMPGMQGQAPEASMAGQDLGAASPNPLLGG